jgi:hypothetical protein
MSGATFSMIRLKIEPCADHGLHLGFLFPCGHEAEIRATTAEGRELARKITRACDIAEALMAAPAELQVAAEGSA